MAFRIWDIYGTYGTYFGHLWDTDAIPEDKMFFAQRAYDNAKFEGVL